ncbi:WSC-domain-containing protein [Tothia fuscella]|uniref:WSC-domain-containing protein n=1 Tax=Tothia fuscella TaxID=1048955 RepID=A0A9P4P1E4_9PEZI|nr:WSC-domain-containing protein [Tothia fuscella]
MVSKYSAFAVAFAALLGDANAFWRMNCANIMFGRIDPIVNPGGIASHAHTVQGGSNFGVSSTGVSLANGECTSCEIQDDKSAYWTPMLYYQYPNGSFIDVKQSGSVVYYIGRGNNKTNSVPFPEGFRMISGDSNARSYDNVTRTVSKYGIGRPIADRVSWACLSGTPGKSVPYINNTDCYAGLRAQVHFQSCWNGVDLYKSDQSHVAYLSDIDNGDCPPTHPFLFTHIFLETSFTVNSVSRVEGGRFVLSTGDPTGYSYHADFQNGWNMTTFARAQRECSYNEKSSGDLNECAVLVESYTKNYGSRCPTRNSTVDEPVRGILPKLPGCIKIVEGPQRATSADVNCPSSVTPPKITPTEDGKPLDIRFPQIGKQFGLPDWQYVGCSNDSSSASRVLNAVVTKNATGMTVETCQAYCFGKGYKYAGLELGTECYCDSYMLNNPVINKGSWTQGMCYYQCSGDKLTYCGGQARVDLYVNTKLPQLPFPKTQSASGKYVHKGCMAEITGRILRNASTTGDTMTPDVCAKFCLGRRFKWFGVEYGRECYCGDRVVNQTIADPGDCNILCAGNRGNTQTYCGGASRANVYFSSTL